MSLRKPIFVIVFLAGFLFMTLVASTSALTEADIVYPAKELNNCKDKTACFAFCDEPANIKACVNFAEKYGLISKKDAEYARKFSNSGRGPGGCRSQTACEAYCNDVKNINECLAFAERHNLMPKEELEEAKKIQQALIKGAKLPGGCRNKQECETYCDGPEQMEECLAFAEVAGFMPPEELEDARKYLKAVKSGVRAPPCRGKAVCDTYCEDPAHFEECIAFAEAAGFISPEEVAMAKKTGGKGPGGCRGKDGCERYCEDEKNFEVCVDFAIEYGFISKEDAELARKTGGKGPGGCKGQDECDDFCQDSANQETCFNFAKDHGLLKEEDLERMEEGKEQILNAFDDSPPEVQECIEGALGKGFIEKIRTGQAMPNESMGSAIKNCFMKMMGPSRGSQGSREEDEDFENFPGHEGMERPPYGSYEDEEGDLPEEDADNQDNAPEEISPEEACTNPSHPGYNFPDCAQYRRYHQQIKGLQSPLPGNQLPKNTSKFMFGLIGLILLK